MSGGRDRLVVKNDGEQIARVRQGRLLGPAFSFTAYLNGHVELAL